ncbi:MAG: class I SAM-dependent methyltransferase [Bdellovibrionota bacterium]
MKPVLEISVADAPRIFARLDRGLFEDAFDLNLVSAPSARSASDLPRFALLRDDRAWALDILSHPDWNPLVINYTRGSGAERLKKAWLSKELLKDALSFRKGERLSIVDGTGGLLSDATLIATWGHRVTAFEQNPLLCFLGLEALDGLAEAGQKLDVEVHCAPFSSSASLHSVRHRSEGNVDRVYLDPLYPSRPKDALGSKELRIVAQLTSAQAQPSLDAMIEAAVSLSPSRIVVKRPQWESLLRHDRLQVTSCEGKSTRFDVIHSRTEKR